MTNIIFGCLGKYLRNNGTESIRIENSVFGPNVVHSVLGGTYYVRSFKGIILLCETMERLQWSAFSWNLKRRTTITKETSGQHS